MVLPRSEKHSSTTSPGYKMMRHRSNPVLHLVRDLEAEDPSREVVDLTILLQRSGWPCIIASAGGSLRQEAERAAVKHHLLPSSPHTLYGALRDRWFIRSIIKKRRPRLLHVHGGELAPVVFAVARAENIPIIVSLNEPSDLTPFRQLVRSPSLRSRTHIIVPTEFMMTEAEQKSSLPLEHIHLIAPGIDLNWFKPMAVTHERLVALAKLWRLPEQGTIILAPLPLGKGMGQELLLETVAELNDPNLFVVLLGRDLKERNYRSHLEAKISALKLDGRVVMPEFCKDWPAALWQSGIVIILNEVVCWPTRLVLAAQAMERPVIVTNCGSNTDLVHKGFAHIIQPNNKEGLKKILLSQFRHETTQGEASLESSRQFIEKFFSHKTWLASVLELYEQVALPLPEHS